MGGKSVKKGFTLIEILVVISVIAFLAIASVVAMNAARMKMRDTKRKADLRQIQVALEYNYERNNAYTQPENLCTDSSVGCGTSVGCGCAVANYPNGADWDANSDLRDLLADGSLKSLPKDPLNNSAYYYIYEVWNAGENGYAKAGQGYSLCATLEIGGNYCLTGKN